MMACADVEEGDLAETPFAVEVRFRIVYWLSVICAVVLVAAGGLWLFVPNLYLRGLPADDDEIWSLPRLNGLVAFYRFQRWISQSLLRQAAWGMVGVTLGCLAFYLR